MNVPKLRFKEFYDEWIEGNFSKTFSFISNNSLSRNDLNYNNQTNIFNIHYGDILTKMNNIVDVSNFAFPSINTQYLEKYNKKDNFLCNGDIVIADTAEDYTAGKSIELQCINNEKIISGLHTIPLRPIIEFSKNYLGYYLNSSYFHNQLIPLITGIKVMSITKSNLENTYIRYPSKNEQEKIGTFLSLLDKKIELQSKKIEALKLYKMCILNKYFNENIKEKKDILKNYCTCLTGKSKTDKVDNNGIYYIMDMGTIDIDGNLLKNKPTFCNLDLLSYGDLIMPKDDIGGGSIIGKTGFVDENNKYVLGDHVYLIKTQNINSLYLHYQINSKYINKQLKRKVTGSAQLGLKSSNILNQEIFIYPENQQKKIATIFKLLDEKVKLENCKFRELESLKKGLMQNMFI